MLKFSLTEREVATIKAVLEDEMMSLHQELADTNNWKLKESLKERQLTLQRILERFSETKKKAA